MGWSNLKNFKNVLEKYVWRHVGFRSTILLKPIADLIELCRV